MSSSKLSLNWQSSVVIYFSGTGNSKFIAHVAASEMGVDCHSIEENLTWASVFEQVENVVIVFPIYGSLAPMILRNFLKSKAAYIADKYIVSFPTQMMFSGDGGSVIANALPGGEEQIVFARHFNLPNNIPNIPFLPIGTPAGIRRKTLRAKQKMIKTIRQLKAGKVIRQGFSGFSKWLGSFQKDGFSKIEKKQAEMVKVGEDCIACGICVKQCPTDNLELTDGKIISHMHCTICMRCVNACPTRAIHVLIDKLVKRQYQAYEED